ncbi:MAG: NUDIX domain-containing protein [Pyrinomonadaceae bacterium]
MTEKKIGDWIKRGTRVVFENDFFTVNEDDVVEPDGRDGKYATIDLKPGVAVLPIDDDGRIHLTRQFRYALERDNIEAIAGSIDGNETSLDAAHREAKEELGIEADELVSLGRIEVMTAICRSSTELFIARGLHFGEPESESTEDIRRITMPLEKAVEMVLSGEITHADTCALILKASVRQKGQRPSGAAA